MKTILKTVMLALVVTGLCVYAVEAAAAGAVSRDFPAEDIPYKVMFKWGLINKEAGRVNISLRPDAAGAHYDARLTAASASWADHFYRLRDTLTARMDRATLLPEVYRKHAHEGGDYTRDEVRFSRQGSRTTGHCTRYVQDKGKAPVQRANTLEAVGTTVDMLSSFYYMRALPLQDWKPGQVVSLNIFSGKRKETLTIKYHGREDVKYDGRRYQTFHVSFIFTSDGGKRSSDDMDAWITTDDRRIPVKLEGKLPVGRIRCFYTGKE